MAATEVMKIEPEAETCCICGSVGSDLLTPEEHDADGIPGQPPLRAVLLHLNQNKVVPEGRLCGTCARRALESYDFSTTLSSRGAPPLSEKIRALRRRLHELTQKIDVFVVVGGPGASAGGAYSEEDIIMVEKDALAAAAAADDEELERARNAHGDSVYQCSICPMSFQRVSEYRMHTATHPSEALHSCWTCGAQFASREALKEHTQTHAALHVLTCYLCDNTFQSQASLRRHESSCASRCPACARVFSARADLAAHASHHHARRGLGAGPGDVCVCPVCFKTFTSQPTFTAHVLRHKNATHYVCGYDGCILRFGTRSNLMAHIRKCHAGEAEAEAEEPPHADDTQQEPSTTCNHCGRTFGSVAALKRHSRVHRNTAAANTDAQQEDENEYAMEMEEVEGEVEYLEVETLEDIEYKHSIN